MTVSPGVEACLDALINEIVIRADRKRRAYGRVVCLIHRYRSAQYRFPKNRVKSARKNYRDEIHEILTEFSELIYELESYNFTEYVTLQLEILK